MRFLKPRDATAKVSTRNVARRAAAGLVVIGILLSAFWGDTRYRDLPSVHLALDPQAVADVQPVPDASSTEASVPSPSAPHASASPAEPVRRAALDGADVQAMRPAPRIALILTEFVALDARSADLLQAIPPDVAVAHWPYYEDRRVNVGDTGGDDAGVGDDERRRVAHLHLIDRDLADAYPPLAVRVDEPELRQAQLTAALARMAPLSASSVVLTSNLMSDTQGALDWLREELAARGLTLMTLDRDWFSPASEPGHGRITTVRGPLDLLPTPRAIDLRLAQLEAEAITHGAAIGHFRPFPVSIERVASWADSLANKGIELVGVDALLGDGHS